MTRHLPRRAGLLSVQRLLITALNPHTGTLGAMQRLQTAREIMFRRGLRPEDVINLAVEHRTRVQGGTQ